MTVESSNYHVTIRFAGPPDLVGDLAERLIKGSLIHPVAPPEFTDNGVNEVEAKVVFPGRAPDAPSVIREAAAITLRSLKSAAPASLQIAAEQLGSGYPFPHELLILG